MAQTTSIVTYICSNHKIHAINCGEDYLPFNIEEFVRRRNETPLLIPVYFFTTKEQFNETETLLINKIFDKVLKKINCNVQKTNYRDYFIDNSGSIDENAPVINMHVE